MSSLLTVLDGRRDEALQVMQTLDELREPEGVFYLARHFAMIGAAEEALQAVQLARRTGFWCSSCLEKDPVFSAMREHSAWIAEIEEAKRLEQEAAREVRQALGLDMSAELFAPALRKG